MATRGRNTTRCQLLSAEWTGNGKYTITVRSSTMGPRAHDFQKIVVTAINDKSANKCEEPLSHPGLPQGATCQMGFSSKSQLNAHIKAVHNLELFECRYGGCHLLTIDGSNYDKHERACKKRPADEPIVVRSCKHCNRSFPRSDNLARHLRSCKKTRNTAEHARPSPPLPPPPADQTPLLSPPDEDFGDMRRLLEDYNSQGNTNASGPTAPGKQQQATPPMTTSSSIAAESTDGFEEQPSHYAAPPSPAPFAAPNDGASGLLTEMPYVADWSLIGPDTAAEDMPSIFPPAPTVPCRSLAGVLPSATQTFNEDMNFGMFSAVPTAPGEQWKDWVNWGGIPPV